MLILPTPKRDLTKEEYTAIRLLQDSGISVMINFSLSMKEGTRIRPRGEVYGVYDNLIESSETGATLDWRETIASIENRGKRKNGDD